MATPILLPELGSGTEQVRVSCWLVEPGEHVEEGDRVVEVLVRGMTFDVPAPVAGMVSRVERLADATARPGDVLGWIEDSADEAR